MVAEKRAIVERMVVVFIVAVVVKCECCRLRSAR